MRVSYSPFLPEMTPSPPLIASAQRRPGGCGHLFQASVHNMLLLCSSFREVCRKFVKGTHLIFQVSRQVLAFILKTPFVRVRECPQGSVTGHLLPRVVKEPRQLLELSPSLQSDEDRVMPIEPSPSTTLTSRKTTSVRRGQSAPAAHSHSLTVPTLPLFPHLVSDSHFLGSRAGDPLTSSVSQVMDSPWPTDRQQAGAETEPCVCRPLFALPALFPKDRRVWMAALFF